MKLKYCALSTKVYNVKYPNSHSLGRLQLLEGLFPIQTSQDVTGQAWEKTKKSNSLLSWFKTSSPREATQRANKVKMFLILILNVLRCRIAWSHASKWHTMEERKDSLGKWILSLRLSCMKGGMALELGQPSWIPPTPHFFLFAESERKTSFPNFYKHSHERNMKQLATL
jgi:hypothetical protein